MSIDVWSALVGAFLPTVLAVWLYVKQRKDSDRDWQRDNQKELHSQAEEFVTEVQAFSFDPSTEAPAPRPGQIVSVWDTGRIFDHDRAIGLIARGNSLEARVVDPVLKGHIQKLHMEMYLANNSHRLDQDNRDIIRTHCQGFNQRFAELYYVGPQTNRRSWDTVLHPGRWRRRDT